jgi:hypothetical protein
MKIVLPFLLLIIVNLGFAQSFSISELVRISKYDDDTFDTYVTKKGYIFYEESEEEIASRTTYTFLVSGRRKYFVTKYIPKNKNYYWVNFQTPNSSTYLKIKEELKTSGYLLIDKGSIHGSPYYTYKKDGKEITLISESEENEYTKQTTVTYEIGVSVYY